MFGLFKKKTTTAESFNEELAEFAKEIITLSAALAGRYLETRKDKFTNNNNNKDIFNTTNEFIFFFFHCISRECYLLKGKKAQIEIYEPIARLPMLIAKNMQKSLQTANLKLKNFMQIVMQ